jgi:hypothetical protein
MKTTILTLLSGRLRRLFSFFMTHGLQIRASGAVGLFIFIFCFAACRGAQTSAAVETKTKDSISIKEIRAIQYDNIPVERALLKIPVADMAGLPSGAGYSQRNGRAGLDISRHNDTIYVSAVCDSLQRRIEYYEMSLEQARRDSETRLEIEKTNGVQTAFKWFLIGVLTGSVITILITISVKKNIKK